MKNITKYVLLAGAALLSACDMEYEELNYSSSYSGIGAVSFNATMDGSASLSKSYLQKGDDKWDVLFEKSDSVSVFTLDGVKSGFGITDLSKDSKVAVFSGDIKESEGYYALYPKGYCLLDGNTIHASLPSEQSARYFNGEYTYCNGASISVAYTTDSDKSFHFSNVTALLRMSTSKGKLNKITLETMDGTPIAGDFCIDMDGGKIASVYGGNLSKIEYACDDWTAVVGIIP